ncbi:hypothetical protein [Rhizobium cremeum]|uniref:hypothetical protein n=1 Tax=Rhizobium cremeum TaxID=2813827 RepID=UPI0039E14441
MRKEREIDLMLSGRKPFAFEREGEGEGWSFEQIGRAAERVVLELKSAEGLSAADRYELLLNELMGEMARQFELFRSLRASAEAMLSRIEADGGAADDAAAKLARADAKAATDAISLIVRTLEKVDALQRQFARDRAEAEEQRAESEDHDRIRQELADLIEERALERAAAMLAARGDGSGDADGEGIGCAGPGYAGLGAGCGPPG